ESDGGDVHLSISIEVGRHNIARDIRNRYRRARLECSVSVSQQDLNVIDRRVDKLGQIQLSVAIEVSGRYSWSCSGLTVHNRSLKRPVPIAESEGDGCGTLQSERQIELPISIKIPSQNFRGIAGR